MGEVFFTAIRWRCECERCVTGPRDFNCAWALQFQPGVPLRSATCHLISPTHCNISRSIHVSVAQIEINRHVRRDDKAPLVSRFTETRAGQCWLALETRASGRQPERFGSRKPGFYSSCRSLDHGHVMDSLFSVTKMATEASFQGCSVFTVFKVHGNYDREMILALLCGNRYY
jgi:hypothetical protein